jgi:hypothetical protein
LKLDGQMNGEIIACMSTFNFDLAFFAFEKEHLPHPPVAQIHVKQSSSGNYGDKAEGLAFISCECMSAGELELEVKRLNAEPDEILRKGRKRFSQAVAA